MSSNKLNYKIINLTALFLLLYLTVSNIGLWIGIASKILSICAPFIVAFVFAYAFTPIVNFLIKKKVKRTFACTIVIVGLLLFVSGILAITLPMLYEQIGLLIKMLLEAFNTILTKYDINLLGYENDLFQSLLVFQHNILLLQIFFVFWMSNFLCKLSVVAH